MPVSRWMKAIDNALVRLTDLEEEEDEGTRSHSMNNYDSTRPAPQPSLPPPPPPPPPLAPLAPQPRQVPVRPQHSIPPPIPLNSLDDVTEDKWFQDNLSYDRSRNEGSRSESRRSSLAYVHDNQVVSSKIQTLKQNRSDQSNNENKGDGSRKMMHVETEVDDTDAGLTVGQKEESQKGDGKKLLVRTTTAVSGGCFSSELPPPPPLVPTAIQKDIALGENLTTTSSRNVHHVEVKKTYGNLIEPMKGSNNKHEEGGRHDALKPSKDDTVEGQQNERKGEFQPQSDVATFNSSHDVIHHTSLSESKQTSKSLNISSSSSVQEPEVKQHGSIEKISDLKLPISERFNESESTPSSSNVITLSQKVHQPPPLPKVSLPEVIAPAETTSTGKTNDPISLSPLSQQQPHYQQQHSDKSTIVPMVTVASERQRAPPPPSPVPGRMVAIPRKPRTARSTLLRGGTSSSSSHAPSTPGAGSRRPQIVVAGESVSHLGHTSSSTENNQSPSHRQKPPVASTSLGTRSLKDSGPLITYHSPTVDGPLLASQATHRPPPVPHFPMDDAKGITSHSIPTSAADDTGEKGNDNNLEVHETNTSPPAAPHVSSGASVGSVVVEYENDLFYDSEGELDVGSFDEDDDDSNSITQSLIDLEKDARIDVIHQSESKDWGSPSPTSSMAAAAVVLGPLPALNEGGDGDAVNIKKNNNIINCRGVVHVRFVQAHNLPCAENTTIQPVLSLPPWKGCIRADRIVTAKGRVRGVHLTWSTMGGQKEQDQCRGATETLDEEEEDEEEGVSMEQKDNGEIVNTRLDDGTMSELTDGPIHVEGTTSVTNGQFQQPSRSLVHSETLSTSLNEGAGGSSSLDDKYKYTKDRSQYYSMVHDYNNEDTPIPSIHLELLTVSLFEKLVASVTISCFTPMKHPDTIFRKWFVMKDPSKEATATSDAANESPEPGTAQSHISTTNDEPNDEKHESTNNDLVYNPNCVDRFLQLEEPLVLLDIWFEPSARTRDTGTLLPSRTSNLAAASDDGSSISASMVTGTGGKDAIGTRKNKPHLFRVRSYWKPSCCALCSSVITLKRGYRCEEPSCGLDCCANCLLAIDVRLPCGSFAARRAVKESIQMKYSLSSMMQIIAPVPEGIETNETATSSAGGDAAASNKNDTINERDATSRAVVQSSNDSLNRDSVVQLASGIGRLHIRIEKAVLFKHAYPPEAYLEDILQQRALQTKEGGDHYVRVSWNNGRDSVRTRTVHQTSKPEFGEEGVMDLIVPHYGAEYKVEVIDADSDKPIGSYLLSTHQMLMMQHDSFFSLSSSPSSSIPLDFKQLIDARRFPPTFHKLKVELRSGIKSGFGLDFYAARGSSGNSDDDDLSGQESSRPGAIHGYVDISACLEEDLNLMYSTSPRQAEERPDPDFNVELIQLHISRIMELIEGITDFFKTINYCVSWENPLLTMMCLVSFVYTCIKFNAEYVGSIPFSCLLLFMLNKARIRRFGNLKMYWVEKEKNARLEAEKKVRTSASVHRPIAVVKVMVSQGRNICSKDLGLPGRYKANVSWRTQGNDKNIRKQNNGSSSQSKRKSSSTKPQQQHQDVERLFLGSTETSSLTMNPVWQSIKESDEILKLKSLLYGTEVVYDCDSVSNTGTFISTIGNTITTTTSVTRESLEQQGLSVDQHHQQHRLRIRACDQYVDESSESNSFSSDPFDDNIAFTAPILQPIQISQSYTNMNSGGADTNNTEATSGQQTPRLLPWDQCLGSVVVQIVADNMLNKLLIYEDIVGEVEISFSQLLNGLELETGEYEVRGWFPITNKNAAGDKSSIDNRESPATITTTTTDTGEQIWTKRDSFSSMEEFHFNDLSEVYLCLRLCLPSFWHERNIDARGAEERENYRTLRRYQDGHPPTDSELELSAAVAEEMIRAAALAKSNATSMIGSGINTINTVGGLLGNVQMIQNQMGNVLDKIESVLNLFTWAQPHRSFVAFGAICILWLALSIVPTRVLVLVGGIVPFVLNFLSVINSILGDSTSPSTTRNTDDDVDLTALVEEEEEEEGRKEDGSQETGEGGGSPANLFINFIEALPTNEDLRRIYYWEGRRLGEKERQHLAKSKRDARVTKLWRALWYGSVKMRRVAGEGTGGKKQYTWETIFMLIQGHRLVWWTNEKQFDETEMPSSYMLLAGHAGLAGLSPIDMRDYTKEELERIVNVFGRGPNGQQKISLLTKDSNQKDQIEEAIIHAVTEEKRD